MYTAIKCQLVKNSAISHETTSSKDMYEAIKDMTDDQLHMKTVVLHYDCYSIPEWNRREFPAILWRNRRANPST